MSRRNNPEIKIVYPDASPAAMLLTEAMIKRSSGKRVVETNSEEKEYTGRELFAGALACKTDTSLELTLRLNPDAMDFALTTLIAKNLTKEERRAIRMETTSMEVVDLLSPCAGGAAGDACTEQSAARAAQPTDAATQSEEQKKHIEVGKIPDKELRDILFDMIEEARSGKGTSFVLDKGIARLREAGEPIPTHQLYEVDLRRIISTAMDDWKAGRGDFFNILNTAILDIKELAGEIRMQESELEAKQDFDMTAQLALVLALTSHCKHKKMCDQLQKACDELILDLSDSAYVSTENLRKAYLTTVQKDLELEDKEPDEIIADILAEDWSQGELLGESELSSGPTWDDVEAEAKKIGQHKTDETDETDKTDEAELGLGEETEGKDNG